ncbi:gp2 domain protein [Mycobacteroides abscessus]|nr:gp2 domain protein [Mycobacteroides abscessus]
MLSIPRQVGKTYLVACIIFALCLIHPGLTVIWTAHRKTTAAEDFRIVRRDGGTPQGRSTH